MLTTLMRVMVLGNCGDAGGGHHDGRDVAEVGVGYGHEGGGATQIIMLIVMRTVTMANASLVMMCVAMPLMIVTATIVMPIVVMLMASCMRRLRLWW